MYTGALITILDVLLIVHAARTGRFMPWGIVILFLPGLEAYARVSNRFPGPEPRVREANENGSTSPEILPAEALPH